MKKFLETVKVWIDEDESIEVYKEYYVGATSNIKALYKSIRRNRHTNLCQKYCDTPKFSESKSMYALCIDELGFVTVINSDTMLSMIIDGLVQEVK